MIHRLALMKMNDRCDAAAIARLQTHVAQIRDELAEVQSYDLLPNAAAGGQGFNWLVVSSFKNEADMDSYRVHPLHVAFVAAADDYTEDLVAVAYEQP